LRVWRGREGKAWEKRNEQVEEIEENWRGGLFFIILNPSLLRELKNCIGGGFWGGFGGFI